MRTTPCSDAALERLHHDLIDLRLDPSTSVIIDEYIVQVLKYIRRKMSRRNRRGGSD